MTEDTTLYGKWAINSYTVTFNTNGGTTVAPVTITYDKKITKPAAPTKVGHTFAGWYERYFDNTMGFPNRCGDKKISALCKMVCK
ncbi:hypothetical protein LSPH24S_03437 [Lysinibacillus sphaericus]